MTQRPLPRINPETQFYWDGAKLGKLLLPKCRDCQQVIFPPRPFCPKCGNQELTIIEASGKARLYSYVINHLPEPGYEPPYVVAVVMLEEGVTMVSNLLDCPADPKVLELDMPLELTFEIRGEFSIPQFRPAYTESLDENS
ncbi:MAG: OB-fold domain-containing protein [Gammaproteobacteria bacterium]|nr:OB-fold domain-containing protein [Gammaproteobacteria bacterium]